MNRDRHQELRTVEVENHDLKPAFTALYAVEPVILFSRNKPKKISSQISVLRLLRCAHIAQAEFAIEMITFLRSCQEILKRLYLLTKIMVSMIVWPPKKKPAICSENGNHDEKSAWRCRDLDCQSYWIYRSLM